MDELTVVTWRVPRAHATDLEAAALPEKERESHLFALREACGASDLVYVPTCQRVLFAFLRPKGDVASRFSEVYVERLARKLPEPEVFQGREAFQHLCETASSLDSLVVGEPQVLGQFKAAVTRCDEVQLSGPGLRHVFSLVFRAAKAVRSETELFRGKVSLVPLTEDLVRQQLVGKARARVAVVGTGQIGQRMIELLRAQGVELDLHVVSRNEARAHEMAQANAAQGHTLASFLEAPPEGLDLLSLAMDTDAPLLSADALARMANGRSLLVLDLAIPRNAEAPATPVEGLRVVQMDELTQLSERAKLERHAEIDAARAVLDRELARIHADYEQRKLAHDLARLSQRFDDVARERLAHADAALVAQDPALQKWYEQTVRALLHEATQAVKKAGCRERDR